LVRFTGALIADGGRKLLLDGKRGAASDGGNLRISIGLMMNEENYVRAHFSITIIFMSNPP
jgi:hypothetical protein